MYVLLNVVYVYMCCLMLSMYIYICMCCLILSMYRYKDFNIYITSHVRSKDVLSQTPLDVHNGPPL